MGLKLDEWQKKVLETKGNIVLRTGRQVGKSTVVSVKAGEYAVKNSKKVILVIASVERQAQLLFEKILAYMEEKYRKFIKQGKDRPTKHRIKLKNGSEIYCLPTGLTGQGIRGYTVDLLIADEAAFIKEEVWTAVTPMLAVTKGDKILLSTPYGKGGYFYNCFEDESYTSFHITSEECERVPKDFLEKEKERMSKLQYAQEYLGEFVDELRQFFPDELIKRCQTATRRKEIEKDLDYYMGIDVGGLGGDESSFEIVGKKKDKLIQVENETVTEVLTTDTTRIAINYNRKYNLKRIYVDDGGTGFGVWSELIEERSTRRKTIAINNASRPTTYEREGNKKTILKEELYEDLKVLMEKGKIEILDDPEIYQSLKSIQYEYDINTKRIKIFGKYTHITEGLIRAVRCMREKGLNIWIHSGNNG